jgi:hypothetical protein
MSEDSKTIARRSLRMLELGDPSLADEIVALDLYDHDAPYPGRGLEGVKVIVNMFKIAAADVEANIEYQAQREIWSSLATLGVPRIRGNSLACPPLARR